MTFRHPGIMIGAAFLLTLACADKAEPAYAKCVQLQAQGDIEAAWSACASAISADPNSTSGKSAAKTLGDMKPDFEKRRAERAVTEAKAAEQRLKMEAEGRARTVAAARRKVDAKFWAFERDGDCTGKGMPPYRKTYEGGTFEEDELVAFADGCVHLFPGRSDPQLFTTFCCPR